MLIFDSGEFRDEALRDFATCPRLLHVRQGQKVLLKRRR
jgi:hypothetical protein